MSSLTEAVVEIERELQVRRNVYPRLVFNGKLTQGEADRRMRAMRTALYYLATVTCTEDTVRNPNTTE
jgi:hypothetical protein